MSLRTMQLSNGPFFYGCLVALDFSSVRVLGFISRSRHWVVGSLPMDHLQYGC